MARGEILNAVNSTYRLVALCGTLAVTVTLVGQVHRSHRHRDTGNKTSINYCCIYETLTDCRTVFSYA